MRLFLCLAALLIGSSLSAAEYKPGKAPLMTRWGKKVTPRNAWTEYPRPQLVRKDWQNLNGLWEYAITKREEKQPAKFDDKILVPFPIESALSGVMKTVDENKWLWYRRTVEIKKEWKGNRILLHFGAVDWECVVWVNGKEVGKHKGGYTPFTFDITAALKKTGANEIIVRVWDPTDTGGQPRGKQVKKPEGIWYTAVTGIWQTVWLEPVAETSIESLLPVYDVKTKTLSLALKTRKGKTTDAVEAVLTLKGKEVERAKGTVDRGLSLKIADPKLWSPDSPTLYDLKVTLKRDNKTLDEVSSYAGLRTIGIGKDDKGIQRLLLNGKALFQVGPLDQGWWPDGLYTPPSDEAMKYDLEVLKKLGFNMLRKHVKVEPARLYYHCDKLGLLVWQDMPSAMPPGERRKKEKEVDGEAGFTEQERTQWKDEYKEMVEALRFFPCIVVWVPFNEGWGQHKTNDIQKWAMKLDETRLVNGPSGWTDRGVGHMKDAHIYPGPGMVPVMKDRVSVLGEFGGLGLPLKGHLWTDKKNWGYRTFTTKEQLREGYGQLMWRLRFLIPRGLSAAVYTQTTDVETEINGLMTYDREVIKLDVKETARWHAKLFAPAPTMRTLVATSEKDGQKWRSTSWRSALGWEKEGFDDKKWKLSEGGFGTAGTPGAVVRTTWRTKEIWLRRVVEIKGKITGEVMLRIHHDEDAEVYINGVLAAKLAGYVTEYIVVPLTAEGRKALKEGKNTIAINCKQTGGGQYIDAGLVEVKEALPGAGGSSK